MSELPYYQYAFVEPECHARPTGPGVDPHFDVELITQGPVGAVVSRIGKDYFDFNHPKPRTPAEWERLRAIATRHNEVICRIAKDATVLPLQLGTVFRSRLSLEIALERCAPKAAELFSQLKNRQEWRVKLYLKSMRLDRVAAHVGPPAPHFTPALIGVRGGVEPAIRANRGGKSCQELHAAVRQTIHMAERSLSEAAENCCRTHALPEALTGRRDTVVFSAAFLLPVSSREDWLETVQQVFQDVRQNGLQLEMTGPWPPYHFCPSLEFPPDEAILPVSTV